MPKGKFKIRLTNGHSIYFPGTYASVGLSRTVIDNKDLQWSAIGKIQCVNPGDRDPKWVDADLNYGIDNRFAIENIITKFKMLRKTRAVDQTRNRLWWPSGLIHHVSNSSRNRRLGPRF